MDLAVRGLEPLRGLGESENPIDKLIALNIILVFISLGVVISYFLNIDFSNISAIVMLVVSFLFGAIVTGAYTFLLLLLRKTYKTKSLRGSIMILFVIIPLSVFGILYKTKSLISLSLLLIGIQFLFIVITSLFFREEKIETKLKNIWNFLGKAGTILGILSSIITIGGFIIKFL